eukprot:3701125-Pleurochrysis_carterae.AAC.1
MGLGATNRYCKKYWERPASEEAQRARGEKKKSKQMGEMRKQGQASTQARKSVRRRVCAGKVRQKEWAKGRRGEWGAVPSRQGGVCGVVGDARR